MPSVAELRDWFERKVLENQRLFYAIAYQVLADAHEAEDVVQAAVCKTRSTGPTPGGGGLLTSQSRCASATSSSPAKVSTSARPS